jgi:glycerophosphoryl diester phosphodiesterase
MRRAVFGVALVVLAACASDMSEPTATDPAPRGSALPPAATTASTSPAAPATSVAPTTTSTASTTTSTPSGPLTVQQLLDLGRPIVLAHAGGEDQFPHSTPYAYGESVKAGVDMLDLDVQLTADGVLVVQHDDTVDRTTNGSGAVASMSYSELAQLDNAYWFSAACTCRDQPEGAYIYRGIRSGDRPPPAGYTPDDFIIPRFRDIVTRFPDLPVNIEIKPTGDAGIATAKELASELAELDLLDNAVVASFDDAVVDAFHQFAPSVETTPGLAAASAFILGGTPLPDGMRILQLPVDYGDVEVLTPDTIAASHNAGYVIWVWPNDHTWENPDGYRALLAMGLDGLNINYPQAGVAAVASFETDAG